MADGKVNLVLSTIAPAPFSILAEMAHGGIWGAMAQGISMAVTAFVEWRNARPVHICAQRAPDLWYNIQSHGHLEST